MEDSYMQTIDKQAKLLEDSSNADRVTYDSTDMANSAFHYTHLHVSNFLSYCVLDECNKFLKGSSVLTCYVDYPEAQLMAI